jgi:hypothetical protein
MNNVKMRLIIIGYCIFLYLMNFSYTVHYKYDKGSQSSTIELQKLAFLISFILMIVLAVRLWKFIRRMLDVGIKIPLKTPVWGQFSNFLLLLPLYIHHTVGTSEILNNGTIVTKTFIYGPSHDLVIMLVPGMAIMLFQTLCNFHFYTTKDESGTFLP